MGPISPHGASALAAGQPRRKEKSAGEIAGVCMWNYRILSTISLASDASSHASPIDDGTCTPGASGIYIPLV